MNLLRIFIVIGLGFVAAGLLGGSTAHAASLELQAQLVWGTDDAKPADPKLVELEAGLKKKLQGVFKWRNYFEVTRKRFGVKEGDNQDITMSSRCRIVVQNLGKSTVEVKLYGRGKLLVTKRQTLAKGELFVLAGDDKNDTAWFVVLKLAEP